MFSLVPAEAIDKTCQAWAFQIAPSVSPILSCGCVPQSRRTKDLYMADFTHTIHYYAEART